MSGLGGDLEGPPVAPQQGSDAIASGEFTIELSEPAARPKCLSRRPSSASGNVAAGRRAGSSANDRIDQRQPHNHDVYITGGHEYRIGHSLGAVEVFAAAAPTPELVRASLESINAALSQSPAGSAGADQPAKRPK